MRKSISYQGFLLFKYHSTSGILIDHHVKLSNIAGLQASAYFSIEISPEFNSFLLVLDDSCFWHTGFPNVFRKTVSVEKNLEGKVMDKMDAYRWPNKPSNLNCSSISSLLSSSS